VNTKHTPGPWHIHGDCKTMIGADDGKQMLAEALHNHVVPEWRRLLDEAQANARLIAAAPELAEALRAMLAAESLLDGEYYSAIEAAEAQARAVLAKLEGGGE